jgi:hypothetical protein
MGRVEHLFRPEHGVEDNRRVAQGTEMTNLIGHRVLHIGYSRS